MKVYTVYPCAHCGHPAPEGLRAHHECALEATRRQVVARAGGEPERERREERVRLDAAALAATRIERARWVEAVDRLRAEYQQTAQQATTADTIQAACQRAAALGELLQRMGEAL